jgi:hypothetical protein
MDGPEKQRKKKDKAREKKDRNGGYTTKHVRIQEALHEKTVATNLKKATPNK